MRRGYEKIKIFQGVMLRDYLEQKKQNVISKIEGEGDDYLLNVNENDYVQYLAAEASIEPLEIYVEQINITSSEEMIPAEYFPRSFYVLDGKSYKKDVIKFHIPFSGNPELFSCTPSSYILWTVEIELSIEEICFQIINFDDDSDRIKREKDANIQNIMQQLASVKAEIDNYNSDIHSWIKQGFDARKKRILAKTGLLASLGVPIKKVGQVSPTFSVPAPQFRKIINITKPVVNEIGFKPEPTLDESAYLGILKLIHEVGKEFERLPSLYSGKEEEHLRDHFLMMLEPNFQGSATGETFNKTGKTDILLRFEGSNVFIAECKFWRGQKAFLDTITQLLGYLTWRDSKAAVILFVPNKDFSSVLQTMKETVSNHPNYLEFTESKDETWINYKFHLNDDRNRAVKLAVMLYHLPR